MSDVQYLNHFSMVQDGNKLDVFLMKVNQQLQLMIYISDGVSGEVNFFTLKGENLIEFIQRMSVINIY